jgi:plastocyanin
MHFALHLVPVLAAEKSKTAFYLVSGALVVWAMIVSMVFGMRRESFPGALGGERAIIAVTAVLVVATAISDVATSGGSETPAASAAQGAPQPAVAPPGEPPPASSTPTKPPTATTGTPAAPSSPAARTTRLALAADPTGQLKYNTNQLAARAGKVTITMANMSPVEHNVTIAKGSSVLGATPTFVHGTKSATVALAPGTYTFYCSVPGHRQAGMEGTLTVTP